MPFWLCLSLALNGLLLIALLRARRVQDSYLNELKATRLVNKTLGEQIERKLGPRKAARIANATAIAVEQGLKPSEATT